MQNYFHFIINSNHIFQLSTAYLFEITSPRLTWERIENRLCLQIWCYCIGLWIIFIHPVYEIEELLTDADDNYIGESNEVLDLAIERVKIRMER